MNDHQYIREMMLAGIDDAFQRQIAKLFEVWFVDPQGQPQRAAAGAQKLIATYQQAVAAIKDLP